MDLRRSLSFLERVALPNLEYSAVPRQVAEGECCRGRPAVYDPGIVLKGANMSRIQKFGVGQTAKVLGVLYAIMGALFIPFMLLASMYGEGFGFGFGFALLFPVIYGVFGFIFTAIGCLFYNIVAGWVGGIEIELDEAAA
jgi:hypothetical protein